MWCTRETDAGALSSARACAASPQQPFFICKAEEGLRGIGGKQNGRISGEGVLLSTNNTTGDRVEIRSSDLLGIILGIGAKQPRGASCWRWCGRR